MIEATGNEVEPYWPMLFGKFLNGKIEELITAVGGGGGGGAAAPPAAAAAEAPKEEGKKKVRACWFLSRAMLECRGLGTTFLQRKKVVHFFSGNCGLTDLLGRILTYLLFPCVFDSFIN